MQVTTAGLYKNKKGDFIVILHNQTVLQTDKTLTHLFGYTVKGKFQEKKSEVLQRIKQMARNKKIKISKIKEITK